MSTLDGVCAVLAASLVIISLRALPFLVLSRCNGEAKWLKVAEKWLSPIVIALLVVYSYSTLEWRTFMPYAAGALTIALQLTFKNGLVSIFVGTALYMILVRFFP